MKLRMFGDRGPMKPRERQKMTAKLEKPPFRPTRDLVLIRRIPHERMSAGGLHLLEKAAIEQEGRAICRGTVIAVGPGILDDEGERVPLELEAGTTVIFSPLSRVVQLDDPELFLVREEHISGVLEEDE